MKVSVFWSHDFHALTIFYVFCSFILLSLRLLPIILSTCNGFIACKRYSRLSTFFKGKFPRKSSWTCPKSLKSILSFYIIVRSIVSYGSEDWQMKKRSEDMLRATEMYFWRRFTGIWRRECIQNG